MSELRTEYGRLWHGDCLELMKRIPDGKIDMVMVDLPYGTTDCAWDSIIPLDRLWLEYNRVCKKNAAMVFTAAQPFTAALIASNWKHFKYCWYWIKNNPTAFQIAKYQPLRNVEEVCVFYREFPTYNPQGLTRIPPKTKVKGINEVPKILRRDLKKETHHLSGQPFTPEHTNYPRQTLVFDSDESHLHATQKPVALLEYLVNTYTNPGELVLDNTCGSGTTAEACILTRRRFVCIEKDPDIHEIARKRIISRERCPGFGLH